VIKDRSGRFQDRMIEKPDTSFGAEMAAWLADGEAALVAKPPAVRAEADSLQAMALRRLTDAGLRPDGIRVMLMELGGEGCRALGQLDDAKLKRLATAGASAATIERWNAAIDPEYEAAVADLVDDEDDPPIGWYQNDA
jgi:hypothetical protein